MLITPSSKGFRELCTRHQGQRPNSYYFYVTAGFLLSARKGGRRWGSDGDETWVLDPIYCLMRLYLPQSSSFSRKPPGYILVKPSLRVISPVTAASLKHTAVQFGGIRQKEESMTTAWLLQLGVKPRVGTRSR